MLSKLRLKNGPKLEIFSKTNSSPKIFQSAFLPKIINGAPSYNSKVSSLKSSFRPIIFKRSFSADKNEEVQLKIEDNTYKISLPVLTNQKVLFALKGDTTIKQFIERVQDENLSVKSLIVFTEDGTKVATSSLVSDIFNNTFKLNISGKMYTVVPSESPRVLATNSASLIADLDKLEQLREQHKAHQFEELKKEFLPLYLEKIKHDKKAVRTTNAIIWAGLGYLATQWCVLARLTWWEFNWDIMEPVTYFVTFGTAVLGYTYFAISKREYTYNDLRDALRQKRMLGTYLSGKFDIDKYFYLEHKLKKLDEDALAKIEIAAEQELEKSS